MKSASHPPIWLEAAAALLVPAAAVGFSRVFESSDTVLPIMGAALVSSAIAILCRRLRLPLVVTAIASFGLLFLLLVNRYAPGTSQFGVIPTGETFSQLSALTDELVISFREMKSPVPAVPAFVAASMVGAWIMAFLTDWGALRLRLAFEPVFPSGLLFIFTSIPPVSAGQNRVTSTLIYALAIAVWSVAQRVYKLMEEDLWLPNHERRGPMSIGRIGAALAGFAVLAGTLLGSQLPWANAEPLYSFSQQQDPTRVVVSPFVNIETRLIDQADVELFTVVADRPSYWRIAGLDTYEDNIWKVAGNFSPQDGDLPGQALGGSRSELTQTVEIKALAAIWLPAAFAPARIEESSAEVTWNGETSSLTVANDIPTSDGVSYQLVSSVPAFSPDELRAAPTNVPEEIAERYLALPGDISPVVNDLAREVTGSATNRYDQMRALQDHFRNGHEYSVRLGDRGNDPIATFLQERVGFCQQFAGTFALMARSLGVPTRVATGFTWGESGVDEEGRNIYTVTGRHTHAWPEVYFDGLGWVPFEPTPGRGLPGAASYTGTTPEQDSLTEPTTQPDTQVDPAPIPEAGPGFDEDQPLPELGDEAGSGTGTALFERIPWRLLLIPLIGLVYVGGMLGYWRLRRQRRRQQSTDNDAKVATAWAEAGESIDLGFEQRRAPYETRTEFAGRLLDQRTPGAELMQQLSELSTVARFHPTSVTEAQAGQAAALAEQVDAVVKEKVPIQTRVKRQLDPRRLVTSPHQARHVASETGRIRSLQGDEKGELVDLTR